MSKENLEKFLKELATDPKTEARYRANPRNVMDEYGVNKSDQDAILRGDSVSIQRSLGGSGSVAVISIRDYKE